MRGNIVQICLCSWDSRMDIPSSDSFVSPLRRGFLHKLIGRGWLYAGSWKRRYCVLDNSRLYFYEGEHSAGNEKSSGVINLDYFDVCEEGKDKKNPHVFTLGTSVRGLFDSRHQFAAESGEELGSWIEAIHAAIEQARNSRRKHGKKRHEDENSPNNSSPDLNEPSCLVTATKDRARGPQGRRPPQRKSMMPTSRSSGHVDDFSRQRSISLSSAPRRMDGADIEKLILPQNNPDDGKWFSLSMEEVDREDGPEEERRRSSSVFDIPQQKEEPPKRALRGGNLLGQHAALTRELEMKLKAGMAPGGRRMPSETEETVAESSPSEESARMERLTARVDSTTVALAALEQRVGQLARRVEMSHSAPPEKPVGDVLLQVTVTLQEAERINAECKRALVDANKAKSEYQLFAKECQETLAKLSVSQQEE